MIGDELMIRWRDVNGSFDANMGVVVQIFETNVSQYRCGSDLDSY